MGYGYYEIANPHTMRIMKRGYGVRCKCHSRGCKEEIDRGLAYLCYQCTWYFCGKHMAAFGAYCEKHDEAIEVGCFAGEGTQFCFPCVKKLEAWDKKYPCEQYHESI